MDVTVLQHLVNHSHTLGLKIMVPCGIPDTIIFPSGSSPSLYPYLLRSTSEEVCEPLNYVFSKSIYLEFRY